mmetsp:Transcript_33997/g.25085  ORF Transcript_33997/g.25085 Transcript_33997/m.25085 type:complete len:104 (+) Transcript_33997:320-631(+)
MYYLSYDYEYNQDALERPWRYLTVRMNHIVEAEDFSTTETVISQHNCSQHDFHGMELPTQLQIKEVFTCFNFSELSLYGSYGRNNSYYTVEFELCDQEHLDLT